MFGIENHVCCTKRTIKPVCQPIEEKAAHYGLPFLFTGKLLKRESSDTVISQQSREICI